MELAMLVVFYVVAFNDPVGARNAIVSLPIGKIRGSSMRSSSGREFLAFRGIPYAKPPIAERRFQDPVPAESFDGIFDARREGPTCMQYMPLFRTIIGSEDCLVVNVYTHQPLDGLLPVMVWIHGGGWNVGSGNGQTDLYGPGYLMDRDIVLVTVNYRLGPLGFLSTEDEVAPGNYGLMDQSLALQWVQRYIQFFGGDPKSVTIFGESAGGASVHYHILSPHSTGLFQKAIAQSGSSFCPWALLDTVGKYTEILGEHLNCPTSPSQNLIECLRGKRAEDIVKYRKKILVMDIFPIAFGPRIDTERNYPFLPDHPRNLIKNGSFNDVPFISGLNQNEGAFPVAGLLSRGERAMRDFQQSPVQIARPMLGLDFHAHGDEITQSTLSHYLKMDEPIKDQPSELEKMFSDRLFFHGIHESTVLHAQHSVQPVYYYYFSHSGKHTLPEFYGIPRSDIDLGVCHADETLLQFRNTIIPELTDPNDKKVSELMLDLWTSFASHGKPQSDFSPTWLPVTQKIMRYLKIDTDPKLVSGSLPFYQRTLFWNHIAHFVVDNREI